jgi:hypothetical protein
VAVVSVTDDALPEGLVVHRVRETAVAVDLLLSLARAHDFPFLDLTRADGARLSVRTEHIQQIWADTEAQQSASSQ